MALNIPDTFLPGDVIRFDFRVIVEDPTTVDAAIRQINRTVWAHPRLNYWGTRVIVVGNLELQRPARIVQVYATVRPYDKTAPGTVQYESLSDMDAYMRAAAVVWGDKAAYVRGNVGTATEWAGEMGEATVEWVVDMAQALPNASRNFSVAALLIAAVVAYAWFFGLPKRFH